jgi:hypothetical protein
LEETVKVYLNKEKIVAWFLKNNPGDYLLAKLNNGQKIDEETQYDVTWIDYFDGFEVTIDEEDPKILILSTEEETRLGEGYERNSLIRIFQPEEDAWIVYK